MWMNLFKSLAPFQQSMFSICEVKLLQKYAAHKNLNKFNLNKLKAIFQKRCQS